MKSRVDIRCAHAGCGEWAHFQADNRTDRIRIRSEKEGRWKCIRHSCADEFLGPDRLFTEKVLVNKKSEGYDLLFFDGKFGFVHGDGYKAYASDFPEGTKLIVRAEIILPCKPSHSASGVIRSIPSTGPQEPQTGASDAG